MNPPSHGDRRPPPPPPPASLRPIAPIIISLLFLPGAAPEASAQRSPVLKDPAGARSPFALRRDRSTEALFDAFMLVRKANDGDAPARHELGLRHLLGEGFPVDTAKAAYWILRAAEQGHPPALYNAGILRYNGWGTEWDPFGAWRDFIRSADGGMPEGMFLTGILLTDNLVVERDLGRAWRWISAAADSGYKPAEEALAQWRRSGLRIDTAVARRSSDSATPAPSATPPPPAGGSASATHPPSAWKPVFLDLGTDTLADPDDSALVAEATSVLRSVDTGPGNPPTGVPEEDNLFHRAASAGAPEALTLLGRRRQIGAGGERPDLIEAAVLYLRAIRSESRWAPVLLWRLAGEERFRNLVAARAGAGDARAEYVRAGLTSRGFDPRLAPEQAHAHLLRAARSGLPDAMVELATWREAGYAAPRDPAAADSLLEAAASLGSAEARTRRIASTLRALAARGGDAGAAPTDAGHRAEPGGPDARELADSLLALERDGSLLAQVMLGYCSETGIGLPRNLPLAVARYRQAAQRWSRTAYDALRILHDRRRPGDPAFRIDTP